MSMNRVQFQPGLSMPEFMQQFGTKTQCETALIQARWPQGFRCPKCDHDGHCVLASKGRKNLSMQRMPSPDLDYCGNRLSRQ